MLTVRVASGAATGPTATAAYDAALAAANAHAFNLVVVSSVLPAGAAVEVVDDLPDLGSPGDRLTVVQSRLDREPAESKPGVAGLGWARSTDGPGILYETSGAKPEPVRREIHRGLDHGAGLREWERANTEVVLQELEPAGEAHACAVVVAAFGRGEPVC